LRVPVDDQKLVSRIALAYTAACATATPRSVTSLTASILNSRLNFRLFISTLQLLGHDLIFVSTKPAGGQGATRMLKMGDKQTLGFGVPSLHPSTQFSLSQLKLLLAGQLRDLHPELGLPLEGPWRRERIGKRVV